MGMRFSEVSLFCIPILILTFVTYQISADIQLGAIRYERDVRGVANYLSTQTTFGGARDKFTRLQQISTVLNLDAVSRVLLASRHRHRLIHRTRMRMSFGRIPVFLGGSVRSNTNPYLNSGSRLISWLRAIERLDYNIYNCIKGSTFAYASMRRLLLIFTLSPPMPTQVLPELYIFTLDHPFPTQLPHFRHRQTPLSSPGDGT